MAIARAGCLPPPSDRSALDAAAARVKVDRDPGAARASRLRPGPLQGIPAFLEGGAGREIESRARAGEGGMPGRQGGRLREESRIRRGRSLCLSNSSPQGRTGTMMCTQSADGSLIDG